MFKIGDQNLLSKVNFTNPGGNRRLKPPFVGPFTIKKLHGKNAVEVILTEEFSRKHPLFPVSLIKPHHSRTNDTPATHVPAPIVLPEDTSKLKLHKILKINRKGLMGKNTRLYLVRYKGKSSCTYCQKPALYSN